MINQLTMVATESNSLSDLPDHVSRVLKEFIDAAQGAFAADLRSIILFGSAAEGRLRATSDVNLVLILGKFERARSDELRSPLRIAQAAIHLSPMFVLESELPAAMTAFAEKFIDILRRRRILFGPDPFIGLSIPRQVIIARLDQVLLNLILRLRQAYVMRGLREEQMALAVADAAGPLRSSAATILELEGQTIQSGKEALATIVRRNSNSDWPEILVRLSEARETRLLPAGLAGPTLLALVDIAGVLRSDVHTLSARR